jgi:hypothetical protein
LILDTSLRLEAVLAGAITTSQPEYHVYFVDWNQNAETTPPAVSRGALNSTSDVTILAAPGSVNPRREVQKLVIYNKDTVSVTVTVKTDDGTTERIERKQTLNSLDSLCWEKDVGWYVTPLNGQTAATQADMEAATSVSTFVSPGRQQYHPSAAKAWVRFNGSGTVAINASYNVSSVTDNGAGDWSVNFTTSFSSANYGFAIGGSIYSDAASKQIFLGLRDTGAPAAGSIRIQTLDVGAAANPDATAVGVVCFGDQ